MTETQEVLEAAFNALWRAGLVSRRRIAGTCRAEAAWAVVALRSGAELLVPVVSGAQAGPLRTAFPYYLRRPSSANLEEIGTAADLLEALGDEETGLTVRPESA